MILGKSNQAHNHINLKFNVKLKITHRQIYNNSVVVYLVESKRLLMKVHHQIRIKDKTITKEKHV